MNRETTDPDIPDGGRLPVKQIESSANTPPPAFARCRHFSGPQAPTKACPYCTVTKIEVNWKTSAAGEDAGDVSAEFSKPVASLVDMGNGGRFPLRGFRFRIGRQADNHIEVKDTAVSRTHAIITFEEEDYYIDDLGSTNGTLLNGRVLTRRERLEEGDVVKMGRTKFQFSLTETVDCTIPLKS